MDRISDTLYDEEMIFNLKEFSACAPQFTSALKYTRTQFTSALKYTRTQFTSALKYTRTKFTSALKYTRTTIKSRQIYKRGCIFCLSIYLSICLFVVLSIWFSSINHQLRFSNPFVFTTHCCRPLICQTILFDQIKLEI